MDILDKYDLTYNLASLNENKMADKLNDRVKKIISMTLQKLEEQKRYQDAKNFALKVKDILKKNDRVRAVLYCLLSLVIICKVFAVKDVQTMANGVYSDGVETVNCEIENDGEIFIEDIKDDVKKEITVKNIKSEDFKLSKEGKAFIRDKEKLSLKAYYATAKEKRLGMLTIGYGHRIKIDDMPWLKHLKEGDAITLEQAENLFESDITYFEKEAKRLLLKNPRI